MEVANTVGYYIDKHKPDAVAIDAGNGTGVIDRLREMGYKVTEVWFGSKSSREEYGNKRTEIWGTMRDWLRGGCIANDDDLVDDLSGPEYKFRGSSDKIILESKEEMKMGKTPQRMTKKKGSDPTLLKSDLSSKQGRKNHS